MNDATDDAFTAALALLSAAADPARCRAHLLKLRRLEKRIAVAQDKLDAAASQHAATKAELDARDAALRKREEACAEAEHEYREHLPREKYPVDTNFFGTLTRAPYTNG
jgi:hypothetical protein